MSARAAGSADDLWAITSYFNPTAAESRRANYRIFRQRLAAPLVAVELAYGPGFELREGDADVLIQIRSGDLMWQKERLLNIALAALPASCRKVAWLDCDVVFARDDWVERASDRLEEIALLQPFSRVLYVPKDETVETFTPDPHPNLNRQSIAFATASGVPVSTWSTDRRDRRHPPGLGLAWAARRDVLKRHGFYDACIIGGGDRAMIAAAAGAFAELMDSQHMNEAQRRRYLAWAEPFRATVGAIGGYLDGDLYHLWHGSLAARSYASRHAGLVPFAFDPFVDVAVAESGAWRWNSDKPALHAYLRGYFQARGENG